ncbi:S1 family peptidase [Glaciibacter superstes]|uniref:S1 family peptidase n=1 Tax=Glaciibacter superstes TaxID=501023 RepID=UPI0003B57B1B|nr:S1 family peptidase [Glaciibacter superstes]
MSVSGTFGKRALAVCAAAALGLGGLLVASPASANSAAATPDAESYAAFAAEVLSNSDQNGVQVIAKDASGGYVGLALESQANERRAAAPITTPDGSTLPIKYTLGQELTAYAENDVVAGAGYFTAPSFESSSGASCSIGFTAWDKDGNDALISAGHCTADGANTVTALTLPSSDTAGGGSGAVTVTTAIGKFGFSQFGGIGNATGGEDTNSIDVAVIDVLNGDLNLLPEITDWTTAASEDLSASTTKVTAVGNAALGQSVSKSGRTTGLTNNATIDYVEGWARIGDRMVYGFGSDSLVAAQGDSGGAVFSGTTALGILSGGALPGQPPFVWASDLQNSLAHTDGYTVKLFIDAPVVTSAAGSDVERGGAIVGTAPAGTTLVVKPATGSPFEVAVDGSGNWTFPAPSTLGDYKFTVTAKSGFNVSASAEGSVNVVLAPLVAPVVTTPANGGQVADEVTELTGTGLPGATVTATGDATGTATVAADGAWKIEFAEPLGYGDYAVSVTQSSEGQKSPAATVAFKVVLAAPVFTSPANGSSFDLSAAPKKIEGTGINGATVQVALSGEALAPVTVVDGKWSAPIDFALIAGDYAVVATQTVDEVVSADAVSGFALTVAPAPVDPGTPSDPAGDGDLANTGFDGLPFLGGAAALLLVGGGALFLMRRRAVTE